MKKIISIFICLALIITVACGCNDGTKTGGSSDNPITSSGDDTSSKNDTSSEDLTEDTSSSSETSDEEEEIEYIYVTDEELLENISIPATTTKNFSTLPAEYSTLLNKNPDRGFRSKEMFVVPESINELKEQTYEKILNKVRTETSKNVYMEQISVSRVYFIMTAYRDVYNLPDEVYNYLDMILQAYAEVGVKVYLGIYYQHGLDYGDYGASKEVIINHVEKTYSKLWAKHTDVIYANCINLIGSYGEWTAIKPTLTDSDIQEIVDKVLETFPKANYLTFRMPWHKQQYVSTSNPLYKRIGFAEDAFFGKKYPNADYGQSYWRPADDNEWWQMSIKESPYAIMDGELFTTRWFRDDGKLYVDGYTAIDAMSELHLTTFSANHAYGDITMYGGDIKETVMYGWKCEEITSEKLKELGVLCTSNWFKDARGNTIKRNCFEYIRDYLGYRISATDLSVTGGTKKNEKINISMNLKNYGFSAAFNLKSGFAILDENNKVISEIEVGDPTTWHSTNPEDYSDRTQLTHNLSTQMQLPQKEGTYKIAFFLRNELGQNARLDNTVEYSDGYNILHMFTID